MGIQPTSVSTRTGLSQPLSRVSICHEDTNPRFRAFILPHLHVGNLFQDAVYPDERPLYTRVHGIKQGLRRAQVNRKDPRGFESMQGKRKSEPRGLASVSKMAEEEGFEPSYGEYP